MPGSRYLILNLCKNKIKECVQKENEYFSIIRNIFPNQNSYNFSDQVSSDEPKCNFNPTYNN